MSRTGRPPTILKTEYIVKILTDIKSGLNHISQLDISPYFLAQLVERGYVEGVNETALTENNKLHREGRPRKILVVTKKGNDYIRRNISKIEEGINEFESA